MWKSLDSFGVASTLEVNGVEVDYYDLTKLERSGVAPISRLPFSLKILLENLLRHEDGENIRREDIEAIIHWKSEEEQDREIAFNPARVLLQDFTGVPAVVDLAAMRDAMVEMKGDPAKINPLVPSELVIDHSVQVDSFGKRNSFRENVTKEFERNQERYAFLRWGQAAFDNFHTVPPATGIVHQVNLEYLSRVVFSSSFEGREFAYPDTLVGTDSHTTMINGLGVLGWGVGGIEAEAVMLGQPISLLIPQVVGFRLQGSLPEGSTATDLVLLITQMLREKEVVGKFVEFYGPGVANLSLADRATIGNMSPEYGATCAIFPIDEETLHYLRFTARSPERVSLVEAYAKAQGLFHDSGSPESEYNDEVHLDLGTVQPSLAGPKRPQDRIALPLAKTSFVETLRHLGEHESGDGLQTGVAGPGAEAGGVAVLAAPPSVQVDLDFRELGAETAHFELCHGAVVIAAITSCANTSNPSVMVGAGLLARKAAEIGLRSKPWVKTSLAPGSKVVIEYLEEAGLLPYLNQLGFNLVGYGCTTCIGNSGPLPEPIARAIEENNLVVCSVLSGNRNFEGRINPHTRANYLASPPLVVAYALAGRMDIDLTTEPLGQDSDGRDIFLKDIWPSQEEILSTVRRAVKSEMFARRYADVFTGDERWQALPIPQGDLYAWDEKSTYIKQPPFFQGMPAQPPPLQDLPGMRVLVLLGNSVTTDHISPAGSIPKDGPSGRYLISQGVEPKDFNSFGSRRGNHDVMLRGTFANIRLRNLMVPEVEGGFTLHPPSPEPVSIYEAAMEYGKEGVPLLVIAGTEYGSGSSRDWAAKGTRLLGVRAVLAQSFERIHRSNLIGMGVLPLQFLPGQTPKVLELTGSETYHLRGLKEGLVPRKKLSIEVIDSERAQRKFEVIARVDTPREVEYYQHGGILHYVLRALKD